MGRFRSFVIVSLAIFLASSALVGCAPSSPKGTHRLHVVASIAPLADFVAQVGGDRVTVTTLIPPGASPHTYEPTPAQVKEVAQARLLVLNGVGLEFWADKLLQSASNPNLIVVDTSQGIAILEGDEHESRGNPHVWLNPRNAIVQVEHIRDALIQADPLHRAEYEARAAAYIAQLEALDIELAARVSGWSQKQFIAFHPAWIYFAQRYGLEQAAVIERAPGREPSPAELAEIINIARRIGARAIFAEPQFSAKAAQTIAEETGAQVLFLNPLGGEKDFVSYLDMMRYNIGQMEKALK